MYLAWSLRPRSAQQLIQITILSSRGGKRGGAREHCSKKEMDQTILGRRILAKCTALVTIFMKKAFNPTFAVGLMYKIKFFWLTLPQKNSILYISPTAEVGLKAFFVKIVTSAVHLARILLPRMVWSISFLEQCSRAPPLFPPLNKGQTKAIYV